MGERNHLVEGGSGTGKTTVCDELQRRGHHAVHGDRELAYQGDPATRAPVDGITGVAVHDHHLWSVEKVRELAADRSEPATFFCGGSRNLAEFIDLFDAVFVLETELETVHRRLDARSMDEWGGRQAERELIDRLHHSRADVPPGAIPIDASLPVSEVVDEILRLASVPSRVKVWPLSAPPSNVGIDERTPVANDQYTFDDPATRYPKISPPADQIQPEPGDQQKMIPVPDMGIDTYRGTGRLAGRRALVTGGDSGIGGAVAIAFAREGADVAIAYLPEEQSDADIVIAQIEAAGRTAVQLPGDVKDAEWCRALVSTAVDGLGGLDIVVNCAGKQVWQESIEDITEEQFDDTMKTNLYAMFRIIKAALPHLTPGSAIINTTSLEASQPNPLFLDYATTKGGINTFSKSLAGQLAPKGIRVNAVAPGPTWTALQVSHGYKPDELPTYGQQAPIGRSGQPAELAPAYVFLASAESSYVIGETLNVNGGQPTF